MCGESSDYALLYRTIDRFLIHAWLFVMPLLTLLSLRSGTTVVDQKNKSVDL